MAWRGVGTNYRSEPGSDRAGRRGHPGLIGGGVVTIAELAARGAGVAGLARHERSVVGLPLHRAEVHSDEVCAAAATTSVLEVVLYNARVGSQGDLAASCS